MKRFYSRFRIMLMTFAFGLASVFVSNGSLSSSNEVPVILPKTDSGDVIVVFPRCLYEMPFGGGSGGGSTKPEVIFPKELNVTRIGKNK